MKRSEINAIMRDADSFIRQCGLLLPPFAYWTPEEWTTKGDDVQEIVNNNLGWDITDWGTGDYRNNGLFLFTVRNGRAADLGRGSGMLYAEKIMISRKNQLSPMHRHLVKAEDIINRGGGRLVLRLHASRADGGIDADAPVTVPCDGVERSLSAGGLLSLEPGESLTLLRGIWHAF